MAFPPNYQGARTDASSATPDDHAADHTTLDQADKDIVAEIVAHEASTTAHGLTTTLAGYQPLDSDLTAIAALTTTSYGRAFLALADAAAGRTALGLGTAATQATSAFDTAGSAAAAQAASQPLDSDLTAIAALSTTSYGRSVLEAANAAALRTLAGTVIGTDVQAYDADLDALATSGSDGTGAFARVTSPTFVTPALGTPSAINLGNATNLPATALPALTGDVTSSAGSAATTLANSGVSAASYGSSSAVPVITFDAKGRATSATTAAIADSPAILIVTRSTFK